MSKQLEYSKDKQGQLVLTFRSNINIDNGHTNEPQGERESEMTLFCNDNGSPEGIDWVVYDEEGALEFNEYIGLEFDGKTLVGYDGVFEIPVEALKLIRKYGYRAPAEDFE